MPEAEPPADLLARVEAALDARTAAQPQPRFPAWGRFWKGWAVGASALATGLATILLL